MESARFRVNSPTVVSETVDGEVIMIHLDTGNYYSSPQHGLADLGRHRARRSVDADHTGARRRLATAPTPTRVVSFVEELRPKTSSSADARRPDPPSPSREFPRRSSAAGAEKYTDMQHLILLDPVHEVDEGEGMAATGQ